MLTEGRIQITELFRAWYVPMVLYATRFVGCRAAAEDAVQDVFVRLVSISDRIDASRGTKNLLFTMLHHHLIDQLLRAGKMQRTALTERPLEESHEQTLVEMELYQRLCQAIDMLPRKNAEVMRMKMEGMDDHDIAEALGISYETVRSHVKHGVTALRGKLRDPMLLLLLQTLLQEN